MQHLLQTSGSLERLSEVVPLARHTVRVTWVNGISEEKDLSFLLANHRMFSKVRSDTAVFATVKVADEGSRIRWSDGSSLSSRAVSRVPKTDMDAALFRSIMADLNLTSEALSCLLGLSRRGVTAYRGGDPIPKHIALAMLYLWERLDR
ncbi:Protein of unknown function [Devosia crocina]|uniref:DUF2442 domain-containing protein n=1 Tax=Devosia crocina TaxID=429728 RepID=A0A1I7NCC7_9HYPH|nr:DUF2442 domain-containing protein [Devosia crocina]SFV32213.1 Protein of unknown function [Devosia crocina]